MSAVRSVDALRAGYEALRTQATGGAFAESPRGLALFLAQGLPAWIRASTTIPATAPAPPAASQRSAWRGPGAEVVRLLTEMALGARREGAIS